MSRCGFCAREAQNIDYPHGEGVVKVCCEACPQWHNGVHTAACNKRTFPEIPGAEYMDDPEAANKIIERLQKAIALAHVVQEELRVVESAGKLLLGNAGWSTNLEMMLDHLKLDVRWCEHAARDLLKG